jgi:ATP-dependent DNA ligase
LIEAIGQAPGRIDKQLILTGLLQTDIGQFICKWTYDPFITYGIKVTKMPAAASQAQISIDDPIVESHLTRLSTRSLTGNMAKEEINDLFSVLDEPSRQILFKILAKDWKVGISNSTIAAVLPDFLPSFGVMRAHPYEEKRVTKFPVAEEPKLDGYRCTFIAVNGKGAFFTRSGNAIEALQYLVEPLLKTAYELRTQAKADKHYADLLRTLFRGDEEHPSFVVDTEAMMGLFSATGALRRKGEKAEGAELHAFDILPYDGFIGNKPYQVPLAARRIQLQLFVENAQVIGQSPIYPTEIQIARNHDDIARIYEHYANQTLASYLARGDKEREVQLLEILIDEATGLPKCLEGAMVKTWDGAYEKKKSYTWLKLKPEETKDLFITGFYNGEAGSENEDRLGGAIVDHEDVEVRVGGGWSSDERDQLYKDWEHDAAILGIDPKVGFKPGYSLPLDQVFDRGFKFLGRMIEVKFNEVTPDGSLRHPRKIIFRDDKAGEALRELKKAA